MEVFSNWTVGKRLLAGFGLSATVLAVIAAVSYYNVERLIDNDAWVKHTYQVQHAINELVEQVITGESSMRAYMVTGDDYYFQPYNAAVAAVPRALDELRKLTADNPNQQRRIALLSPLIDQKLVRSEERR